MFLGLSNIGFTVPSKFMTFYEFINCDIGIVGNVPGLKRGNLLTSFLKYPAKRFSSDRFS